MPDAAGNFKGISVPELPWLRDKCERCGGEGEVIAKPNLWRVLTDPCPDCGGTGEAPDPTASPDSNRAEIDPAQTASAGATTHGNEGKAQP